MSVEDGDNIIVLLDADTQAKGVWFHKRLEDVKERCLILVFIIHYSFILTISIY